MSDHDLDAVLTISNDGNEIIMDCPDPNADTGRLMIFTPDEARAVAMRLLAHADLVERRKENDAVKG